MRRISLLILLLIATSGCSRNSERLAEDPSTPPIATISVEQVDEGSDLINIYAVNVRSSGEAPLEYTLGDFKQSIDSDPETELEVLLIASLEEATSSTSTESEVLVKIAQYTNRSFTSTSRRVFDDQNISDKSINNYIKGFKSGDFSLAEGETINIGILDNLSVEVSNSDER